MNIKCEHAISYSSDKDAVVLEDVFWMYNPTTKLGLAGFKFDGVIYVAKKTRPEWHENYNMDTAKPHIISEKSVASFIKKAQAQGMQLVFNVLTGEYNGIAKLGEKFVEEKVAITFSGSEYEDRRIANFSYRDVDDLVVTKETTANEGWLRKLLAMEDLRVPYEAQKSLTREQIVHRYEKMTEVFREKQPIGQITIPDFHMYFQSVRHVMHYAVDMGDLGLLKNIHKNYVLSRVEPTPDWITDKVILGDNEDIQKYFLKKIPYSELPWRDDCNLLKTYGARMQRIMGEKPMTALGRKMYERYFIENFKWGAK